MVERLITILLKPHITLLAVSSKLSTIIDANVWSTPTSAKAQILSAAKHDPRSQNERMQH